MFHSNPGEMGKPNLETMDRYIDIDTALGFIAGWFWHIQPLGFSRWSVGCRCIKISIWDG